VSVEDFLQTAYLASAWALLRHARLTEMVGKEFLQTVSCFSDEVLFEKVSEGRILLWFWHVRHRKEN
jgi:hypothetical protein